MTLFRQADYCYSCVPFLKAMESCPRIQILQEGNIDEIIFELVWVIASTLPYVVSLGIFIHWLTRRTSRGFLVIINLLIHQVSCALLKRYFAQPRPDGACSNSFGYPSGHSGWTAALATWLILESFLLQRKASFKFSKSYSLFRNSFIFVAPLIPISRLFLNYHSVEQILTGLLNGFTGSIIYFAIVLFIMIRLKQVKVPTSISFKLWKEIKFENNFMNYQNYKGQNIVADQDQSTEIVTVTEKDKTTISPLQDDILVFLENTFNKVHPLIAAGIQEEKEKNF